MASQAYLLGVTIAMCALLCLSCARERVTGEAPSAAKVLLRGGTVYDGTGAPPVRADVLIAGDSVVAIGKELRTGGAKVINCSGLVVCPGFIDVHNHTLEGSPLGDGIPTEDTARRVLAEVGQGITTLVVGMDGSGQLDVAKYAETFRRYPKSANFARLVGHSAARRAIVGREKRQATPEELAEMAALIDKGMKDGAFGLSSGLEYLGDYATTEEVIALAKAVAPYGGYYETHLRNEDVGVFDATAEAIRICREAGNIPLSISHIKVGSYEVWHQAPKLERMLDDARATGLKVYANIRSSICWASDLKSFDPDNKRDLAKIDVEIRKYWPDAAAYCFDCPSHPELVGKTLDKIAASWNVTPAEALVRMWDFKDARFEFNAMTWEDKAVFFKDPYVMISSDGGEGGSRKDPMIWSCFPIWFALNRQHEWLPMEDAVRRCTGLPAEMLGLRDRGVLKAGMKADVVVFDPKTIDGERHWDKYNTLPRGIALVMVNGVVVMDHGKHTGKFPGRMILKK